MENPYIHPSRIKAALRALELRPTRGMGQNFLLDQVALNQIVNAAELSPTDTVLEVGPGLGVLTWELVQQAGHIVAVELDRRLIARLHEEFATEPKLRIVQSDILRITPSAALADSEQLATNPADLPIYKVVANLPYAITSAALRHFLEAAAPPTLMVVLVQWEVAERITAKPGDLSVLAHSVQIYAEAEIIARVPSSSFLPSPAVDSAILRLRVRPEPLTPRDQVTPLLRLIKSGFLQARKMLSNSLPGGLAAMGAPLPKEQVLAALQASDIAADRRAETVTIAEWQRLYAALYPAE